jgi:hypothetical protein
VLVLKLAQAGRLIIAKVSAPPLTSEADGAKKYACPAITLTGGVPEIVGGVVGGVDDCAAAIVIRNGPTVALPTPSETPISISFVVPTSAVVGVPLSSPVAVLKLAQEGIFVMSKVSAELSGSETPGV